MGSPTGVADARSGQGGCLTCKGFKGRHHPLLFIYGQVVTGMQRYAGTVITTIFQLLQSFNKDRVSLLTAGIAHDSTHSVFYLLFSKKPTPAKIVFLSLIKRLRNIFALRPYSHVSTEVSVIFNVELRNPYLPAVALRAQSHAESHAPRHQRPGIVGVNGGFPIARAFLPREADHMAVGNRHLQRHNVLSRVEVVCL